MKGSHGDTTASTTIFRIAPKKLDEWSQRTLAAGSQWGYNSLRETSVAVRHGFFSPTATDLIKSVLADAKHPLHWSIIDRLRFKKLEDRVIGAALVDRLSAPIVPQTNSRTSAFELRLELIDAIGRQGGPEAEAALMSVLTKTDEPPRPDRQIEGFTACCDR